MNRRVPCRRVLSVLPLHVGGDLTEAQADAVEEHVASCDSCATELRAYERSRQSLFLLKTVPSESTPDLWPAVRLRIGAPRIPRRSFPLRAAAALLLVLAGAGLLALLPGEKTVPAVVNVPPPAATPRSSEYMLAEVRPAAPDDAGSFTELPSVVPAEPGRSAWDEF